MQASMHLHEYIHIYIQIKAYFYKNHQVLLHLINATVLYTVYYLGCFMAPSRGPENRSSTFMYVIDNFRIQWYCIPCVKPLITTLFENWWDVMQKDKEVIQFMFRFSKTKKQASTVCNQTYFNADDVTNTVIIPERAYKFANNRIETWA